ncbi:MAG: sulfur carrier protein ThiS [Acidobacteriota bacterium]|nr:MAG: sulfur carrier protein ThiS [Acidobacteriota bacterium]
MRSHETTLQLTINGRPSSVQASSVGELLVELGYGRDPHGVAVAVDGAIIVRSRWHESVLEEGARVEIVGAVQGG